MDYWNADGSTAQMCGNGARLFARYLVDAGWQPAGRFEFVTRGGVRAATVAGPGDVTIEMGPVALGRPSWTDVDGTRTFGRSADVGNPHLACLVDDLDQLDLSRAPDFNAVTFPEGVNLEFYCVLSAGRVRMRVFERGVGETRSCGTGTVAVAAVHLAGQGRTDGIVSVQVPGGRVAVRLEGGVSDRSGFTSSTLTGPNRLRGDRRP